MLSNKTLEKWLDIQKQNTIAMFELRMDASQWNASDEPRRLLYITAERISQANRALARAILAASASDE